MWSMHLVFLISLELVEFLFFWGVGGPGRSESAKLLVPFIRGVAADSRHRLGTSIGQFEYGLKFISLGVTIDLISSVQFCR